MTEGMKSIELFVVARVLHVVGVVLWIGGVAFVTTVLIPSLRSLPDEKKRFELFERLERRFALQAKFVTAIAGLSGFYMTYFLDGWSRFAHHSFWWMHLMVLVWLVFSVVLFVLEPTFLHRWFSERAKKDSDKAFRWLQRMHIVLLTVSLIAIMGAVTGSRGFNVFQ